MTPTQEAEKQFHQVQYLASYPNRQLMPHDGVGEIAFIGRSNSGKSTLLNRLCGQKRLARVGKTPGVTRAINIFALNSKYCLVDLPGYGYAKMGHGQAADIAHHVQDYLQYRQVLNIIVLIVDSRRGLQDIDWQVLGLLPSRINLALALSKIDKLNRTALNQLCIQCNHALQHHSSTFAQKKVFAVSSLSQCKHGILGMDALRQWLFNLSSPLQ